MYDTTQLEQTYQIKSREYRQKLAAGDWDRELQAELQQLEHQRRCIRAGAPGTPDGAVGPRNGARLPQNGVAPTTRLLGKKLTAWQVQEIRAAWKAGAATRRELAKRYNVAPGTITDITTYRIWADLPDEEVAA